MFEEYKDLNFSSCKICYTLRRRLSSSKNFKIVLTSGKFTNGQCILNFYAVDTRCTCGKWKQDDARTHWKSQQVMWFELNKKNQNQDSLSKVNCRLDAKGTSRLSRTQIYRELKQCLSSRCLMWTSDSTQWTRGKFCKWILNPKDWFVAKMVQCGHTMLSNVWNHVYFRCRNSAFCRMACFGSIDASFFFFKQVFFLKQERKLGWHSYLRSPPGVSL